MEFCWTYWRTLWAGLDEDAAVPRTPGDIRCPFRRLEAPGGNFFPMEAWLCDQY